MKIIILILFLITPFTQPYPKVYVEWVDIVATDSGWHTKDEIEEWLITEVDTVKQMGFLYKETKSHIILIDSYLTADYLGAAIKIPKGNIIKLKKIN
jgi:hypothetical protein